MLKIQSLVVAGFALAACGSSEPAPQSPTPAADTFAAQKERGAAIYAKRCASCHGADGTGGKAPALVGAAALPKKPRAGAKRDVEFGTALDVFQWVKKTMPGDAPGSLTDAEYVDVLAFDLAANGVELDRPLDAAVAATLKLGR